MSDAPFDHTNIGLRERPVSGDLNQMESQIYRTIRELARFMLSPRASNSSSATGSISSFIADGLRAVPSSPAAMTLSVGSGMGFLYDPTDLPTNIGATDLEQVNDLSANKPLCLLAPTTFAVPAAPAGPNSRIDIIEIRNGRRLENAITRRQLDPGTESFIDHAFFKTLAYGADGQTGVVSNPAASTAVLSYKIGTAANPGLVPATTAGYVKIAEILVPAGTTSITGNQIIDRRKIASIGGNVRGAFSFRHQWLAGSPVVTIVHVDAPPGIEISVIPDNVSGGHSTGSMVITGGEMTGAVISAHPHDRQTGNSGFFGGIERHTGVSSAIFALDSSRQTLLNGGGNFAGIGQKCISTAYTGFLVVGGVAVNNNAGLDDVIWEVHFQIGYH